MDISRGLIGIFAQAAVVVVAALLLVAVVDFGAAYLRPHYTKPTVILGALPTGTTRPVSEAVFTYPESAIRVGGAIYIANALGRSVERISDGTITTILHGDAGDVFNDVVQNGDKLLVLNGAGSEILTISLDGQVLSRLPIPKMDGDPEAFFSASSLDASGGSILVSGVPSLRVSGGGVIAIGASAVIEYTGGDWRTIARAEEIGEPNSSFRDAVYDDDGSIAAIAGEFFGVIAKDGTIKKARIGQHYGGGIRAVDGGWLVGVYTQVLRVSSDMLVSPFNLSIGFANVGDIQPDGDGGLLITDTDRQVVYELANDGDGYQVTAAYGAGQASLKIVSMAKGPKGELLLLENSSPRVLSYSWPWGVRTIAGSGRQERAYGGNKVDKFAFFFPSGMAVAPDGTVYVTEANYRIDRITNGRVEFYAGGLNGGVPVPGQKIKDVKFGALRGLAFDNEGRLLIADRDNNSIWRVEKDDTISRVMGTGEKGVWKEGEPADTQPLNAPVDVLAREDGSILIADSYNNSVVEVDPQGIVRRFAGKQKTLHYQGFGDYSGDGGPALDAEFNTPWRLAEGPDGSVYIVDQFNNAVRRVAPDGTISTIAGGKLGRSEDGSEMNLPAAVAVIGDTLYVGDTGNSRVMAFPIER